MKYLIIAFVMVIGSAFTLAPTNNTVQTYTIDIENSKVFWTGKKIGGSHTGTIDIKLGTIIVQDNSVVSTSLIIDMKTIKDEDGNQKLEGHLRSDDFFSVKNFPEASLVTKRFIEIPGTGVGENNYNVLADLTIKGITNEVSFPVRIYERRGILVVEGGLTFDRSKYGVRFGSTSFFDNLGNHAISNDVELRFSLLANKKTVN
ncbi:MAG: YceI family protein [Bacteroidetes bacterium]|nr:YceI family protein [Bacteroidota bacterium]